MPTLIGQLLHLRLLSQQNVACSVHRCRHQCGHIHFDQQRSNGWRLHNTLSTAMFDPRTNCLTDAGKAHVKWIVTNAPQARRVVFVLQDANQQVTSTRVESTQLAISEVIPVGPLPQIYLTDREPSGSSGVYQTAVHRAMANSVPSPRLTAAGGSSGSSGSGTGTP